MRKHKTLGTTGLIDRGFLTDKIILGVARKRKQVIYGARSIQAQAGLFARNTKDYDIFDANPKKTAKLVQKLLDKNVGFDYYFSKEADHKGTWKVKGKGADLKANTKDDESIADYTKPEERISYVRIKGLRYRVLREELKRKVATVKDPEFEFRHKKDKDDIKRIKGYIKIKKLISGGDGYS
jgi:hypothetical protein